MFQPVPNYTVCWRRHVGVNNLPKVVMQFCPSDTRTHDLLITSPMPLCPWYQYMLLYYYWCVSVGSGCTW